MSDRHDLAEHLRFFAELGVEGISRDASWRRRPSDSAATDLADPAQPAGASGTGPAMAASAVRDDPMPADAPAAAPASIVESSSAAVAAPSPVPGGDPAVRLATLRDLIGIDCARCKLHAQGRSQVVFGVGDPKARLMFVGEAPGHDEDVQGEPFVGRAGQLLTEIITKGMRLRREDVYIANVIKCRPPGNRNPEPDEIATCEPFLFEQIAAIQPKVIVALGKFAAQTLLRSTAPISKLRGQVFSYRGALLVPTFHPAFLLRSPDYKREAWEDLKKVRSLLNEP